MPTVTEVQVDLAKVAEQVGVSSSQVERTVALLDDGNTVPFITRFRRDETGGLDERRIALIATEVGKLRQLVERKRTILRSIAAQGKLTPELAHQIELLTNVKRLEDLYLPYRPQRQPLAEQARRRGLEQLADEVRAADPSCADLAHRAAEYADPDRDVPTVLDALTGAGHILADRFSQRSDLRQILRRTYQKTARLVSKKSTAEGKQSQAFADYFNFSQPMTKVPPHRILAINRGDRSKFLTVRIEADDDALRQEALTLLVPRDHPHAEFLSSCVKDALTRLVLPSLEREVRRDMTQRAEAHAVGVFARNLQHLQLQPPVRERQLLAVDPGLKNGCRLAALDAFGRVLELGLIHTVGADERRQEARAKVAAMIATHDLSLVAIGNGAGCREFAELLGDLLETELAGREVAHMLVNAAGASVYSTSALGREELPNCDATERSAISIGRRVLDPLSELVKIPPAHIGVGMYQHDVKARHLRESLDAVVQSCVNYVGVDLNTASPSLLRYVSGLNQLTARRLFDYRKEHGPFTNREQVRQVPGIGAATFVQAAGFLKIEGSTNPLDATWIHPESYAVAERVLEVLNLTKEDLRDASTLRNLAERAAQLDAAALAAELNVGQRLLTDILDALRRPGRDPREALPRVVFHQGILKLSDLKDGMELLGTVLNVVDFGAFVDIGLPDSGLVHVSQMASRYIRSSQQMVTVGQRVKVWVTSIDKQRRRVALTMIRPDGRRRGKSRRGRKRGEAGTAPEGHAGKPATDSGSTTPSRRKKHGKERRPESRKPAPLVPITTAMKEGHEPLRTFSDLLQFQHKKENVPDEQPPPEVPGEQVAEADREAQPETPDAVAPVEPAGPTEPTGPTSPAASAEPSDLATPAEPPEVPPSPAE
jgi:uncharacterized protein